MIKASELALAMLESVKKCLYKKRYLDEQILDRFSTLIKFEVRKWNVYHMTRFRITFTLRLFIDCQGKESFWTIFYKY